MLILIQGDFPYRMCCKSTKYNIEKSSVFERNFVKLRIFNFFLSKIKELS